MGQSSKRRTQVSLPKLTYRIDKVSLKMIPVREPPYISKSKQKQRRRHRANRSSLLSGDFSKTSYDGVYRTESIYQKPNLSTIQVVDGAQEFGKHLTNTARMHRPIVSQVQVPKWDLNTDSSCFEADKRSENVKLNDIKRWVPETNSSSRLLKFQKNDIFQQVQMKSPGPTSMPSLKKGATSKKYMTGLKEYTTLFREQQKSTFKQHNFNSKGVTTLSERKISRQLVLNNHSTLENDKLNSLLTQETPTKTNTI